jgi:hypothetical protein
MAPNAFTAGMVGSALLIGAVAGGAVLNVQGTVLFAAFMAVGAAIAAVVSSRWPGPDAAFWKLWLTGVLANPAFLVGAVYSIRQYECLVGDMTGWECMFSELGLVVSGLCVIPPAIGLAFRMGRRRRERLPKD